MPNNRAISQRYRLTLVFRNATSLFWDSAGNIDVTFDAFAVAKFVEHRLWPDVIHLGLRTCRYQPGNADPTISDKAVPFAQVPYAAYRSEDLPEGSGDWLQFRDDDTHGPSFGGHIRRKLKPHTKVRMTATDASILIEAVKSGVGKCFLTQCLGDAEPGIVKCEEDFGRIERVLHLHINPDTVKTKRVSILIEEIKSNLPKALNAKLLPYKLPA